MKIKHAHEKTDKYLPDDLCEELLKYPCSVVEPLPLARRGDDLQLLPRRELLLELVVHLRGQLQRLSEDHNQNS